MAASVRETGALFKSLYSTTLKIRITPKLATAFRYLIYKRSKFVRHKIIRALPNVPVR